MHNARNKSPWGRLITTVMIAGMISFCATGSSWGQQFEHASLNGTVLDLQGAKVPNATVEATEQQTGEHFTTTTNQDGVYSFLSLPIGKYEVDAEASGFSKSVETDVMLSGGAVVDVDFRLKVGSVTTSVTVEAPLVESAATSTGFDLPQKEIAELPLELSGSKRDVSELISAMPGVTNQGFGNNIMGGIGLTSELIIDGASATYAPSVVGVGEHPASVETIQDFQVVNSGSAEYGMTGGGAVVAVTKSGTNQLHGDAYEYLRNDALDAHNYFATQVTPDKEDEFGFTVGGPIRKNRTFYFGQFDEYLENVGVAGQLETLPTAAMRQGDFSALLGPQVGTDVLGRPVYVGEIYDPSTTRDVNGTLVRDPFPGNIIAPSSDLSAVSVAYQKDLPTNVSNALVNNYVANAPPQLYRQPSYFIKFDQKLGEGLLSGSFREGLESIDPTNPQIWPQFYGGQVYHEHVYNIRTSYARPITNNMTNVFTFGLDRYSAASVSNPTEQQGVSTIGLQGVLGPCTPNVLISGGFAASLAVATPSSSLGDGNCGSSQIDNMWKYNDNVGYLLGKHSIKFGVDLNRYMTHITSDASAQFGFAQSESGLPGQYLGDTGYGYADFLLGEVDNTTISTTLPKSMLSWTFGGFAQDEYRVTPKLTLSYGLRWDWQPQFTIPANGADAPANSASQFNPTIPNTAAGGIPGALEFLGNGTGRDGKTRFSPTFGKGFGPRFGIAYSFNQRTVLRASYALFWAQVSEYDGEFVNRQGFYPSLTVNSTSGGVLPAFNWNSGAPAFNTNPDIDPTIANGQSTMMVGANGAHPPQIQIMNISAQRELPGHVLLEVQYNRNMGHHLHTADHPTGQAVKQLNQLDYSKYGSLGSILDLPYNSPEAIAAGVQSPYPGFSGTTAQALVPYPQYLGIAQAPAPIGNSIFDGGVLKLERRFSKGLTFQLGYIYSKTMSDMTSIEIAGYPPQDAYNLKANWSVSDVDERQNFVGTYAYDLPFGIGQRFSTQSKMLDNYVLGGWTLSGVNSYQTGYPLGIATNIDLPTTTTNVRPNIVPGINPVRSGGCSGLNPTTDLYLNSTAFADPSPFTFGDAPRLQDNARTCASLNENVSLMKAITTDKERIRFQIGADFFNVFNRHVFNSFQTDLDSPGFGTVTGVSNGRQGQVHGKIIW